MPSLIRFKVIHWYLVPLIALVVWWGMLIALLLCWSIQGHPIYAFMGNTPQNPVYISDVGATNLQPLFISCVGFQAIFFAGTPLLEHYLRSSYKLQPYVSTKQPRIAIPSIVCAVIGQLGILFVSIFNTNAFHSVHMSMVALFIVFIFFSCAFNFLNSFIFGWYPKRLSPDHERVIFGKSRWQNLYMVSFLMKCVWLMVAFICAVCFGCFMAKGNESMSARFEWTLSFWYGLLLLMWTIDLFPSAIKHYKRTHPLQYPPTPPSELNHLTRDDQATILTFGSPTFQTSPSNNLKTFPQQQEQQQMAERINTPVHEVNITRPIPAAASAGSGFVGGPHVANSNSGLPHVAGSGSGHSVNDRSSTNTEYPAPTFNRYLNPNSIV